jgi:cyclopropane fatty-acyl-phospholipid synthase-like methyltransferase
MFLRKPARAREPLPITMTGVRMGERVLQIGVHDPELTGTLAARPGLSGHAAIVTLSEAAADRARQACNAAGALADITVTTSGAPRIDGSAFDAAIVHDADPALATLATDARVAVLRACHQALRPGGRLIVIDSLPRHGLAALLSRAEPRSEPPPAGTLLSALEAAGFRPVRLLAEREGYRFIEGLKG